MVNRITHIRKLNVSSSVEHITAVRGVTGTHARLDITVEKLIEYLKKGYTFYVETGDTLSAITHHTNRLGNEYIKTEEEDTEEDRLLSLPQF